MARRRLRPKITQRRPVSYPDLKTLLLAGGGFIGLAILIFLLGVFWGQQQQVNSLTVEKARSVKLQTETEKEKEADSAPVSSPSRLIPEKWSFFNELPDKPFNHKKPLLPYEEKQKKSELLEKKQAKEKEPEKIPAPPSSTAAVTKILEEKQAKEKEPEKIPVPPSSTAAVTKKVETFPGDFVVQVASSSKESEALSVVEKLRKENLLAYIQIENIEGKGTYYRVRIGNFKTRSKAEETARQLKEKGIIKTFWITNK